MSTPANGKVPYQPWAMQEKIAHREGLGREVWSKDPTKRLYYDPQAFCLKDVPRYSERGYELVQTKDTVIEMLNWGHIYRIIPLGAITAAPQATSGRSMDKGARAFNKRHFDDQRNGGAR